MSGHSKWATTKRRKDAVDSKRSNIFTKLSRNISLAAKQGTDPEMNFSLRLAIDKAKSVSMPKDKIETAIKRGAGELVGEVLEELMYEAYAPGGAPMLVEVVTDNKNRTTPEIRAMFSKAGGSIGAQNSVKWMFDHKGVIHLNAGQAKDKDNLMLKFIEFGADDVVEEDEGLTVYTSFENFEKVRKQMQKKNIESEYSEIEWVAKDKIEVDAEVQEKIERLIEQLEAHDDVNGVYTNLG